MNANKTIAEKLAELAVSTTAETISEPAFDACRKMLVDTFAVAIAGKDQPGVSEVVQQVMDWGGKGESSVFIEGQKVPAPNAAFANSVMIHAMDLDDIHIPSVQHIMSSIVPSTMASAESENSSGIEFMCAVILGVEVATRIGIFARQHNQRSMGWGFLPSSVEAGFGATAAACRLLGLDTEATANAMGIYYAQTGGNRQALLDMTLTKRLQPGFSARSALWAVQLARCGITGPTGCLDGKFNLFSLYYDSEKPEPDEITEPKQKWEIERITPKKFASCGACHPTAKAALDIAVESDFDNRDIQKVEFFIGGGGQGLVGGDFSMQGNLQVNAQFCAAYWIAKALVHGEIKIEHIRPEIIEEDKKTVELTRKITRIDSIEKFPDLSEKDQNSNGRLPHAVAIYLKNGKTIVKKQYPHEQFFDPDLFTFDKVCEKAMECAEFSSTYSPERMKKLISSVQELESVTNIQDFIREYLNEAT